MSNKLPWKNVWITGAGRGIGKSLALLCAQQGMTVYASSRTASELNDLVTSAESFSGSILPRVLDITDQDQIALLMNDWDDSTGLPDLVILNAGTHDPFTADNFSADRCKRLLDINLQGSINCLDPVLKRMLFRNSGHIAVMASVAGYRGLPTASIYGASKAALINLCEALKLDLGDSNLKLQVINPGFVRTKLTDKNAFKMPGLMDSETAAQRIMQGLLSQRFEIVFPKRFVWCLKLLRILPYSWYFKLIGKTVNT